MNIKLRFGEKFSLVIEISIFRAQVLVLLFKSVITNNPVSILKIRARIRSYQPLNIFREILHWFNMMLVLSAKHADEICNDALSTFAHRKIKISGQLEKRN